MTQPTFEDGPPVPLMTEGLIDAATLQQLMRDLQAAAQVTEVREKSGPIAYAAEGTITLETAIERLQSGQTRAIQVRYRFDGFDWTDTIMALPNGFRVVRCRHSD